MKRILKNIMNYAFLFIAVIVLFELLSLLVLLKSVEKYKQYWTNNYSTVTTADKVVYIALGDSAAQGVGASSPRKGYVGLLADYLKSKNNKNVDVINLSVSGAKVTDVIDKQLPELAMIKINPETIITLDIGANDLKNFDEASFTKQIDKLYSRLPKQTIVADIPYFGGGIFRSREPNAVKASEIIKLKSQKYNLRLAELHEITKERDSLRNYAADYFHPNNRGYINWFTAYKQVLNP